MKSRRLVILAFALAVVLAATSASARMTREDTQTFPLAADGQLSLENVNGDVTIEAWDRGEVMIATVIEAKTEASLEDVEIRIDAGENRIHVETVYSEKRRKRYDAAEVDYTIHMPRTAHVRELDLVNGSVTLSGLAGNVSAEIVNGRAEARELAGDIEMTTVNGSLKVSLSRLAAGQSIELESVNGSLDLLIPGDADADVEAETVHGHIRNDFGLHEKRDESAGSAAVQGTLGRGGASVQLETVNGSIDIRQAY